MKKLALIAALCALIASPAFADINTIGSTSQVKYTGVSGGQVTIGGTWHSGAVLAGSYNLIVDGVSMQSFCIDIEDNTTTATVTYDVKALADAADPSFGPMGATRAALLAELLSENWVDGMTNTQLLSLQVAVWEVVADGDGTLDLGDGSFEATNTGAATLLASLNGTPSSTAGFVGLSSGQYQDYVVKVPVPAALWLGLMGLGAAGAKLRRKSA